MTRLPRIGVAEDARLEALYGDICDVMDIARPSPFYTSMSVRPDLAGSVWNLMKVLVAGGQLPASLTQLVFMTISAQAGCRYCERVHRQALESMGIATDVVEACARNVDTAPIPDLHREILRFALRSARDPSAVSDADVEALRELGVSDAELVEIGITVALTKLLNTWADAAGVELEEDG